MGIDTIQPGRETEKGGHMAVYKVGKSRSVTNMYPDRLSPMGKPPLGPQMAEVHTGTNRQTVMVVFFGLQNAKFMQTT